MSRTKIMSHKKYVVATKKSYLTSKTETHVDKIYLVLHRKGIQFDKKQLVLYVNVSCIA